MPAGGRSTRRLAIAAGLSAIVGCGLDSDGLTSGLGHLPDPMESSGGDSSGTIITDTAGGTAQSGTGGTTSGSATTSEPAAALLEIDPAVDFGAATPGANIPASLSLTNTGTLEATSLSVPPPAAPFFLTGENCSPALAPGASCTVALEFSPLAFGPFGGTLQVNYDNGALVTQASSELSGRATGSTDNLVQNPGAEVQGSPPPSWNPKTGSNWTSTTTVSMSGAAAFTHGNSIPLVVNDLEQVVDISAHSAAVDAGMLDVHIEGSLIGEDAGLSSDTATIVARFVNGATELASHTVVEGSPADWQSGALDVVAPAQSRQVALSLRCTLVGSPQTPCQASFDDISLVVSYD